MNNQTDKRIRERGIALLFALGILSLLMILGLAFVTNSVISRKVAYNNSSRSQAKVLALGAINRVAGAVMLYQYNLGNSRKTNNGSTGTDDIIVSDLSTIVSHYEKRSDDDISIKDDTETKSSIADTLDVELPAYQRIRFDHTPDADKVQDSDDQFYADLEGVSGDEKRKPDWIFVDNGMSGDDRRIIGRYAYRVLPPRSDSRINLHQVLDMKNPAATDPLYGSIEEVPLGNTPLSFWTTKPETIIGSLAPTLDIFRQGWASEWTTEEMKKTKWLKRWFDDGIWPGEMEVFESAVDGTSGELVRRYYHRFNMNRDDWGDFEGTSLNGVELNSDAAVQELMKDPVEFRNSTTFNVTDKDAASPLTSGLRFLNMIGSDKGGFTTLEFRRKQIAANIIDYCDKDSVPTSDVPASEWKNNVISGGAFPKYTGNEKTPYINEFAIGLDINPTLTGANGKDLKVNVTITPEMIGELINIYAKTSSDNYKLLIHLKAMTIKLKIKGTGKVSFNPPAGSSADFEKEQEFTLATVPFTEEIECTSTLWKDGYLIASKTLPELNATLDFAQVLQEKTGGAAITGITDFKANFDIVEASFEVNGIVLTGPDGGSTGELTGADFVRWSDVITLPAKQLFTKKVTDGAIPMADDSFALEPEFRKLVIAGMQARDPRQNLFAKLNPGSPSESDWSPLADINWVEYDLSVVAGSNSLGYDETNLLTMNLDLTKVTFAESLDHGLVNKEADPSGKASDGDAELVTDPAWRDDAKFTTDSSGKVIGHLSTAYIRNKPMLSLWELGAIHRAAQWQTINLKNAAKVGSASATADGDTFPIEDHMDPQWNAGNNVAGTSYYDGDGAILDQVKLGNRARSYGKIDWNMLKTEGSAFPIEDNAYWLGAMLQDTEANWRGEYDLTIASTPYTNLMDILNAVGGMTDTLLARSEILRQTRVGGGKVLIPSDADTDREKEEVAGKVMNLMKAGPAPLTTFQAVIIAQTIQDVDGLVYRLDSDGNLVKHDAKYGTFDLNSSKGIYFDDITGEMKILVTFDRNPATGKIKVRNIEFLESRNYNADLL